MMFFINTSLPERTHTHQMPQIAEDDDEFVFEYRPEIMDEETDRMQHSFDRD